MFAIIIYVWKSLRTFALRRGQWTGSPCASSRAWLTMIHNTYWYHALISYLYIPIYIFYTTSATLERVKPHVRPIIGTVFAHVRRTVHVKWRWKKLEIANLLSLSTYCVCFFFTRFPDNRRRFSSVQLRLTRILRCNITDDFDSPYFSRAQIVESHTYHFVILF